MSILSITPEARQHLIKMLERSGFPAIELKLEVQGCNGFKYVWQPGPPAPAEYTIDLDNGFSVLLQRAVVPYILGSEVVLEQDQFNKRVTLNNPNVAHACGCGESVNFK